MIIKLVSGALPQRATESSSGFDVALLEATTFDKPAGHVYLCRTGISLAVPRNIDCQLRARSSLCKYGLLLANGVGTIDSDYRGEILVPLVSWAGKPVALPAGARVAQLVFTYLVPAVRFVAIDKLDATSRGAGGFGHTGVI